MKSLPLGIDFGTTAGRIAVLALEHGRPVFVRMIRVARLGRDDVQLGRALAGELRSARIRERRCIVTVQEPAATMRALEMPGVRPREMHAIAHLEAERIYGEDRGYAGVGAELGDGRRLVGIARKDAITQAQTASAAAGLRPIAVDHAGFAFRRLFPAADVIIDAGSTATRFHTYCGKVPWSALIDIGGTAITAAIARAYQLSEEQAEQRKIARADGGAEHELALLADAVGRTLRAARAAGCVKLERIVFTGNGARLPSLLQRIERDTGCIVDTAMRQPLFCRNYGEDVIAAALPDWALALAAATWALPPGETDA